MFVRLWGFCQHLISEKPLSYIKIHVIFVESAADRKIQKKVQLARSSHRAYENPVLLVACRCSLLRSFICNK